MNILHNMTDQEIMNELKPFGIEFTYKMCHWLKTNKIPLSRGGKIMTQVWQDGLNACQVLVKN